MEKTLVFFKKHEKETMQQAVQKSQNKQDKLQEFLDGSTLGKIEIKGRDALEFMNLMYTNAFTKMKPMTARYALMLGERWNDYGRWNSLQD